MKTIEIKEQFEQLLSDLKTIDGFTIDSAIQVAQTIVQESGKDRRTELLNREKSSNNGYCISSQSSENNGYQPATYRQKNALTKFGIQFSETITKSEASELLDKAFEKLDSNKKGS